MMISNIRENGEPIGALPDGEMMFHHDMIHPEVPSKGTLLYSVEIPTQAATRCSPAAMPPTRRSIRRSATAWKASARCIITITATAAGRAAAARRRSTNACIRCSAPMRRPSRKAVYVNRLMTVHVLEGMPQEESDRTAERGVRSRREAGVRLRARLAGGRSAAVGQPLLLPCAHRFPLDRAPADAAHHRQGHRAAVLVDDDRRASHRRRAWRGAAAVRVGSLCADRFLSRQDDHACRQLERGRRLRHHGPHHRALSRQAHSRQSARRGDQHAGRGRHRRDELSLSWRAEGRHIYRRRAEQPAVRAAARHARGDV